jgi:hypothetical protein
MDRWRSPGGHLDDYDHLIWRADRLWLSRWPSAVVWLRPLRECPAPARAKDPGRRRANCWPLRGNPFHPPCTPPAVKQLALIRFTINRIVSWAVPSHQFRYQTNEHVNLCKFGLKVTVHLT